MAADDETEAYALAMDEAIAAAARAETERDTARVEVQRLEGIVEGYQTIKGATGPIMRGLSTTWTWPSRRRSMMRWIVQTPYIRGGGQWTVGAMGRKGRK